MTGSYRCSSLFRLQESNTSGKNVPLNQMCDHSFVFCFFSPSICSQLPSLCSRAVQLGSLYVRGLSHLLGANCASGSPLPSGALMPWHSFDGRLFHSKYLLAHSGVDNTALLEGDVSDGGPTKPLLLRSSADFIHVLSVLMARVVLSACLPPTCRRPVCLCSSA